MTNKQKALFFFGLFVVLMPLATFGGMAVCAALIYQGFDLIPAVSAMAAFMFFFGFLAEKAENAAEAADWEARKESAH